MGRLISHHLLYQHQLPHPPVFRTPHSDQAPGKGNTSPPFSVSFEPWFILVSRNSICFCCSSPSLRVQWFNEVHPTDKKGTSITLLHPVLLGASKICFSKSLRGSFRSPAPTGKECPFPDWPQQSNQQRCLRTGCAILENKITLKKVLLAYLPYNDRRADAKHSSRVFRRTVLYVKTSHFSFSST